MKIFCWKQHFIITRILTKTDWQIRYLHQNNWYSINWLHCQLQLTWAEHFQSSRGKFRHPSWGWTAPCTLVLLCQGYAPFNWLVKHGCHELTCSPCASVSVLTGLGFVIFLFLSHLWWVLGSFWDIMEKTRSRKLSRDRKTTSYPVLFLLLKFCLVVVSVNSFFLCVPYDPQLFSKSPKVIDRLCGFDLGQCSF